METYIPYALNRIFDTGIGVVFAMVVNSMFPGGFTFRWMDKTRRKFLRWWRVGRKLKVVK